MKQTFLLVALLIAFAACNNRSNKVKKDKEVAESDILVSVSDTSAEFESLLHGTYNFPESVRNNLPLNSATYFSSIRFPYYFPKTMVLEYNCRTLPFTLADFYIFNKDNGHRSCEYIALIDTGKFTKIIARRCSDMESWIVLFTISRDYKIIEEEFLMNGGGNTDDEPLVVDNKTIEFYDDVDTLRYENGVFMLSTSSIFGITQDSDKVVEDVGYQTIRILKVKPNGKITYHDSVSIKKDYIDKYQKTKRLQILSES